MADLKRTVLGFVVMAASISIVGPGGGTLEAQAVAQVPKVSDDPMVQRQVDGQLAPARLDPNARVGSLSLTAMPLKEIIDTVARAGGITVRYASGIAGLDAPSTFTVTDKAVEDALRIALEGRGLTFQAMGPKSAFVYADTPANRAKYTASIRVFPLVKADLGTLAQQLNQALSPTAGVIPAVDGFRVTVVQVKDPPTMIVRAIPELMTPIAAWIAEHNKAPFPRD